MGNAFGCATASTATTSTKRRRESNSRRGSDFTCAAVHTAGPRHSDMISNTNPPRLRGDIPSSGSWQQLDSDSGTTPSGSPLSPSTVFVPRPVLHSEGKNDNEIDDGSLTPLPGVASTTKKSPPPHPLRKRQSISTSCNSNPNVTTSLGDVTADINHPGDIGNGDACVSTTSSNIGEPNDENNSTVKCYFVSVTGEEGVFSNTSSPQSSHSKPSSTHQQHQVDPRCCDLNDEDDDDVWNNNGGGTVDERMPHRDNPLSVDFGKRDVQVAGAPPHAQHTTIINAVATLRCTTIDNQEERHSSGDGVREGAPPPPPPAPHNPMGLTVDVTCALSTENDHLPSIESPIDSSKPACWGKQQSVNIPRQPLRYPSSPSKRLPQVQVDVRQRRSSGGASFTPTKANKALSPHQLLSCSSSNSSGGKNMAKKGPSSLNGGGSSSSSTGSSGGGLEACDYQQLFLMSAAIQQNTPTSKRRESRGGVLESNAVHQTPFTPRSISCATHDQQHPDMEEVLGVKAAPATETQHEWFCSGTKNGESVLIPLNDLPKTSEESPASPEDLQCDVSSTQQEGPAGAAAAHVLTQQSTSSALQTPTNTSTNPGGVVFGQFVPPPRLMSISGFGVNTPNATAGGGSNSFSASMASGLRSVYMLAKQADMATGRSGSVWGQSEEMSGSSSSFSFSGSGGGGAGLLHLQCGFSPPTLAPLGTQHDPAAASAVTATAPATPNATDSNVDRTSLTSAEFASFDVASEDLVENVDGAIIPFDTAAAEGSS